MCLGKQPTVSTNTFDTEDITIPKRPDDMPRGTTAALSVCGLTVQVDGAGTEGVLLSEVSLTVGAHESVGLIGASGSGKTRLLYAALGVPTPGTKILRGTTSLFGRPLVGPEMPERMPIGRAPVAFCAQDPFSAFVPDRHLGGQIREFVVWKTGVTHEAALADLMALLLRLGFEDPPRVCSSYPVELSGGQLQRLQVAMAILARPRLIVADEPTASLDAESLRMVVRELTAYRAGTGGALLVASHDLGVIGDLCDTVYVLDQGRILESGTREALAYHPADPITQWLLSAPARLRAQFRQG